MHCPDIMVLILLSKNKMDIKIVDINGKETGRKVTLPEILDSTVPNDHAIYLDVKQYMANQRQGTHKSKERAEIARTTKKLKRQKGTGGARAGSRKSPLFIGGGRAFGPRPRDYNFKLNKKLKKLARLSALAYKVKQNEIMVVEDFHFEKASTRKFSEVMKNLQLTGKKTLLILDKNDKNLHLSSRNLSRSKTTTPGELNTYDLLNAQHLLFFESSVKQLETVI